jgi:hypothetical protein
MISVAHNQILNGLGEPAGQNIYPVWRRQQEQQNQAAGNFLRDASTGRFYRNPTTGKFKRSSATVDCPTCCAPSACSSCPGSTKSISVTFSGFTSVNWGTKLCTVTESISTSGNISELEDQWTIPFSYSDSNNCYYCGCFSSPFQITFPSLGLGFASWTACNLVISVSISTIGPTSPVTISISAYITPFGFGACNYVQNPSWCEDYVAGYEAPNYPVFLGSQTFDRASSICGENSGTSTGTGQTSVSVNNNITTTDCTLGSGDLDCLIFGGSNLCCGPPVHGLPSGPGLPVPFCDTRFGEFPVGACPPPVYGGSASISFVTSATGTGTSANHSTCTSCNLNCTGTGTGTGTSAPPCNCGSSNPCVDTDSLVSVNLDALSTCDPDMAGLVIPCPRTGSCPSVQWQGTGTGGANNITATITWSNGCYNIHVVHPHVGLDMTATATSLTGTYEFCNGNCMQIPVVTDSCTLSNCDSQCGDCIQLGTTFSFVAPVSGYMRLIYNDQYSGFWNNSGSFTVVFTGGTTGTYTVDGRAQNGSPGPFVVMGTTYTGTASGTCCNGPPAMFPGCCNDPDGVPTGSCPNIGPYCCNSLVAESLVAQICSAAGIYCDGICDDSLTTLTIDTSGFNDGVCTSSNTETANQVQSCTTGGYSFVEWDGAISVIGMISGSCYQLTLYFPAECGTWVGTCCTPTGIYCETYNDTGKSVNNVHVG